MPEPASDQSSDPRAEDATPALSGGRRVAAWLDPAQEPLVASVVRHAGLELVCAGTASKHEGVGLSDRLGCAPLRDLRTALTSAEADLILIASGGEFGARPGNAGADDASAVLAAQRRGVRVATLDPVPSSVLEFSRGSWRRPGNEAVPRLLLLPRHAPVLRNTAEVFEQFGPVRAAAVECWGARTLGGLGARLVAGLDLIELLMGEPEQLDAAYVGPGHGRTLRALPGESLRDLSGVFTANLRLTDGRAASLVASDQTGRPGFRATLVGAEGSLHLSDAGLLWTDPDGREIDRTGPGVGDAPRSGPPPDGQHAPLDPGGAERAARAIADELDRLLDPALASTPPVDPTGYLSMAHAALLSARTGQAESPEVIRKLVATA